MRSLVPGGLGGCPLSKEVSPYPSSPSAQAEWRCATTANGGTRGGALAARSRAEDGQENATLLAVVLRRFCTVTRHEMVSVVVGQTFTCCNTQIWSMPDAEIFSI